MKIVIIEDELKTARALAALITTVEPEAAIVASLQSVKSAIEWFTSFAHAPQGSPDLVFMDIQLADGLCFDIFREAPVNAPVIFCTAYDEYAIEGFKANGIDYILKPFSEATLTAAFQKVKSLRNHFHARLPVTGTPDPGAPQPGAPGPDASGTPQPGAPDAPQPGASHPDATGASQPGAQTASIHGSDTQGARPEEFRHLFQQLTTPQGKNSFLVFKDNKYTVVETENIAFFYSKGELPILHTFEDKEYFVSQSLDTLETLLPAGKFFRASRQFLVCFKAVKEVEHYFSRKLLVHLTVRTPEDIIVSKDKAGSFLHWLDNR